ncbi:MAG TPA: LPS-assembly protein LptD [Anaeromyxobacter sp.]
MPTLAVLAAAGLAARLVAGAPPAVPVPAAGDVRIEGNLTYEPGTGVLLVKDGAVIRRGDLVLRARSATYDPATGEIRASGGVLLSDPTRFVKADGVRLVLDGPFEADGVVAFVKDVPTDLSRAADLEAARAAGRNRLTFSGSRLRGDASGRFLLEGARLTLCDCPGGCAPSWELTSRRADVVPGVRATLSWPVLRVTPRFLFVDHPVPVLVLPWLYVPLGERQTGLLLPEVLSTGATGLQISEPVFVTLGRSADATLTPLYAFGRSRGQVAEGKPAVRGPGGRLELRWAPAEDAGGQVQLAYAHDLDREPLGEGGDRLALSGRHAQRISDRTSLDAALRLPLDAVWVRDLTADVLGRDAPYARSDLLLSHRRESFVLELGASYLEPLRPDGYLLDPATGAHESARTWGALGAGLDVASRWPAAAATLVPVALGPLRLSGRAGLSRFAPPSSAWDSGACWNVAPGTCADGPRRAAADRGDARAEVSAPLVLGDAVSLTPYLRGAATAYAFEADHPSTAAAWGVGGVAIATEVSRRFGSIRHAIAPRLEWRAGTASAGEGIPWTGYDALDRSTAGFLSAAPPGAWQQLRGAVETRLAADGADLLRLEVGQDYDARLGRFAETFAGADVAWRGLGVSAAARFLAIDDRPEAAPAAPIPSRFLDRFTELRASASYSDGRGDLLRAGFVSIGPGGSGTLLAGIDPLFDLRPSPMAVAASASAGARVVAGGATLGYDVLFPGRDQYVPSCAAGGPAQGRPVSAWRPQQQVASAVWNSPCRCFRITALVRHDDCGDWSYSASLDLSRLAEARAGR